MKKEVKTIVDSAKIDETLERGVESIFPNRQALKDKLMTGNRLKLYCGYDPTASTLHIGNAITLRKLGQFQRLGHEVVMLIGDFTGMIGDPTDKLSARKKLSRDEVLKNSENYKKIASKFLDFSGQNPAKILYNSQWQDELAFKDLIELASNFTVQQMISRDMFQERIKEGKPIFLHEFLYPLAQAQDSVVMDVDLEVGGNDQVFNMLCGRDLMKALKNKEKFVMGLKLLADPSGKKMGKTEGNMVMLDEPSKDILGKIMSWPDEMILPGFEIVTDLPQSEIQKISKEMKQGVLNPRDAKMRLAKEVVVYCHSQKEADEAEKEFDSVFKENEIPEDIKEVSLGEKSLNIMDILVKAGLVSSKSEAKRMIEQGALKIDKIAEKDWKKEIEIKKGMIIQVGKRKFAKIV